MSTKRCHSQCPTDALVALVRDVDHPSDETGEFSREQKALFEHLEQCDSCRKLLESSAAPESSWHDIQTALNAAPLAGLHSGTFVTRTFPRSERADLGTAPLDESLPTDRRAIDTRE
ncbi:MAG: hypothetical protein AAGG44_21645, partial [Planctomycetota bacterium]